MTRAKAYAEVTIPLLINKSTLRWCWSIVASSPLTRHRPWILWVFMQIDYALHLLDGGSDFVEMIGEFRFHRISPGIFLSDWLLVFIRRQRKRRQENTHAPKTGAWAPGLSLVACQLVLDDAAEAAALTRPSSFIRSLAWMFSRECTASLISRDSPSSARPATSLSNFSTDSSHVNG